MDRDHQLNNAEPVLTGVCARLANWADVNPLLVRVNVILGAILLSPIVIPAYAAASLLGGRQAIAC